MNSNPYNRRMAAKLAREERELNIAERRTRRLERHRAETIEHATMPHGWFAFHCDRLGCNKEYLEDALLRGWTSDQIAELPDSDAGRLAGPPPAGPEHAENLRKIREAPV